MDYNLQNYKGFIFDLDGTLINSMPFHIRAWQQVGKSYGFTVSEDDINTMTGSSGLDIAKYLKDKGNNIPDLKEFVSKKIALYQSNIDKIEVFEDIKDILLKGRADNKKIAIGTGSRNINARTVLEKKGLLNLIDVLITAEDVVVHKPDPETFLKAAMHQFDKVEIVMKYNDNDNGRIVQELPVKDYMQIYAIPKIRLMPDLF